MLYLHLLDRTRRASEQKGAGMAEYTFLVALIAFALIGGFRALADGIGASLVTTVAQF